MTTCGIPDCPNTITDRSPSPDFCSDTCQDQWHRSRTDPWPWVWGTNLPDSVDALSVAIRARIAELGGAA